MIDALFLIAIVFLQAMVWVGLVHFLRKRFYGGPR